MSFDVDLFVIGGGSGGVRAARIASEHGARVALAEESRMGGTCVIRGCVPKKLMVFASGFPRAFEDAAAYGWDVTPGPFDWPRFRTRLHSELDRLEQIYRRNLGNSGVAIHDQRAVVAGPHAVRLADGTEVSASHILIATGGRPHVPDTVPGRELAIVSDDIFLMETLPRRILIVGGGYIACEFACILSGMGVKVTQFYRGAQILRGFDDEVRGHIAQAISGQGVDLRVGCDVVEMRRKAPESSGASSGDGATPGDLGAAGDGSVWVRANDGTQATFDAVLYATGRDPSSDGIGLAEAGVKIGRRGQVVVDDWSQTAVPSIFAIGDVTDRIALTPVAIREGHAFADTMFGDHKVQADHDLVPGAVFTQPEYGYVGMTEEAAREDHRIEVYCTDFKPMRGAFAGREDRCLFKLIVDADDRRVLGCHIVAENAGEMIQLAAVAIKMGATKEDFDRTVAVHPTVAEELVTMRTPVRRA